MNFVEPFTEIHQRLLKEIVGEAGDGEGGGEPEWERQEGGGLSAEEDVSGAEDLLPDVEGVREEAEPGDGAEIEEAGGTVIRVMYGERDEESHAKGLAGGAEGDGKRSQQEPNAEEVGKDYGEGGGSDSDSEAGRGSQSGGDGRVEVGEGTADCEAVEVVGQGEKAKEGIVWKRVQICQDAGDGGEEKGNGENEAGFARPRRQAQEGHEGGPQKIELLFTGETPGVAGGPIADWGIVAGEREEVPPVAGGLVKGSEKFNESEASKEDEVDGKDAKGAADVE